MKKPKLSTMRTHQGWRAVLDYGDGSAFITAWHDSEEKAKRAADIYQRANKEGGNNVEVLRR